MFMGNRLIGGRELDNQLGTTNKKYISWPVIALMDFVTIMGFDDLMYPLQNQGLAVVFTWVAMIFLFVIPYEMSVTQLGATFGDRQDSGLASWVRRASHSDVLGYATAWMYWAACLPYIVDVANSTIVALGWLILGNNSLGHRMSNFMFGLLTFVVILIFVVFENFFQRSLEIMSTLGGFAMFFMTILFVVMTVWSLLHGGHIATQPFNLHAFIPSFSSQYWSTTGLLMFAACGAEIVIPYLKRMKHPNRDFPKSMWMLAFMTAFLAIFGTLALAMFFNANHLPNDLKMNGSFYAFRMLGERMGLGKSLMYIFAVVQTLYMLAQLAVLLDSVSWVIAGDVSEKFIPKWFAKRDKNGRPMHSYVITSGLCLLLLLLSGTLPSINSIFNWLLNLNGIVFPFKNCWIFIAFILIRWHQNEFKSGFVFIKKRWAALGVGWFCLIFSFVCAMMGFLPQDVAVATHAWNHQLLLNLFAVFALFVAGLILPVWAWIERRMTQRG